jgi:hypothetical protein
MHCRLFGPHALVGNAIPFQTKLTPVVVTGCGAMQATGQSKSMQVSQWVGHTGATTSTGVPPAARTVRKPLPVQLVPSQYVVVDPVPTLISNVMEGFPVEQGLEPLPATGAAVR